MTVTEGIVTIEGETALNKLYIKKTAAAFKLQQSKIIIFQALPKA